MSGKYGPGRQFRERQDGTFEEVDAPHRITIQCTASGAEHYVRTFTSSIPKSADKGRSPLEWRMQDNEELEVLISGRNSDTPKGVDRQQQSDLKRFKLRCPVCKHSPVEVRLDKLGPILDTLARANVPAISLVALAARLRGASTRRAD